MRAYESAAAKIWIENDSATDLNHTWFRKNENRAGRWTSPDPYNGSASVGNPQSWNRYSYVESQPTNYVDPSGLEDIPDEPGPPIRVETHSWGYTISSWWWIFFGVSPVRNGGYIGEGGSTSVVSDESTCERMARVAQDSYDQAVKALGKDATAAQILSKFDEIFSNYYVGRRLDGWRAAWDLYQNGPKGRTVANDPNVALMTGQGGFRQEFWQGDDINNEQTHHFGAYFSGGINGMYLATLAHWLADDDADQSLGTVAYDIGADLRSDPSELKNIGDTIRKKICKP